MKKLLSILLLSPLFLSAQTETGAGIKWTTGLSWEQVKQKAKQENKYIFIDCYATWCGPCKTMDKGIIPLEIVGKYFNDKFINIKVQFDSTKKDDDKVKKWYKDAKVLSQTFGISEFPTYLFFSPSGELVNKFIGANKDPEYLIGKGKDAIEFVEHLKQFEEGKTDISDLKKLSLQSLQIDRKDLASKFSRAYIQKLDSIYTKDNLQFIGKFTTGSADIGFPIFLKNSEKVDQILGKNTSSRIIQGIIAREEIMPIIRPIAKNGHTTPDWKSIKQNVIKKYPDFGEETFLLCQVWFYQTRNDWNKSGDVMIEYMRKYSHRADDVVTLNSYAMIIFEHCTKKKLLRAALDWAKRSISIQEYDWNTDTYAGILYKLGKKKEAIAIQEKAVALGNGKNAPIVENLAKMKHGEKTW